MMPLQEILAKYNLSPKGVIHVGAHWAEEHEDYLKCGIKKFVYIEPCSEAWKVIANKLNLREGFLSIENNIMGMYSENVRLYPFACGSEEAVVPMYVSHNNQGQSNSLLEPLLHIQQHPEVVFNDAEVVKVVPLDKLDVEKKDYDFLMMDVQGFEGEVLKGATETLKHINIIYTEVNRGQTYKGNMEIYEMDAFLFEHGFVRKETYWPSPNWTWGDAIYIRKSLLNE